MARPFGRNDDVGPRWQTHRSGADVTRAHLRDRAQTSFVDELARLAAMHVWKDFHVRAMHRVVRRAPAQIAITIEAED